MYPIAASAREVEARGCVHAGIGDSRAILVNLVRGRVHAGNFEPIARRFDAGNIAAAQASFGVERRLRSAVRDVPNLNRTIGNEDTVVLLFVLRLEVPRI